VSFVLKGFAIGSTFVPAITVADLDGDGKPDLIVSGVNLDNISILRNKAHQELLLLMLFQPFLWHMVQRVLP